jgi:hypothetical protein
MGLFGKKKKKGQVGGASLPPEQWAGSLPADAVAGVRFFR